MINVQSKSACCGCYGCENICPKDCIEMKVDNEGFWYPKVDEDKCVNCGLCEKVCPIINTPKKEEYEIKAYECKNNNEDVRLSSSSGGVFTLLCEEIIENDGVVFGASFDENFDVRHTYSETLEGCIQFRGSKYVQSKIGNSYKQAKEFLDSGRFVLFSGTPCQITGLEKFLLNKVYDNLITVDIACHGVPSPLVYRTYINKLKEEHNANIKNISFRDKQTGWSKYSFNIEFNNGDNFNQLGYENIYMKGFLKDIYLRPSCYSCDFKKPITSADITLADYWGVENIHQELDDDKGISLILVNSKKGQRIFEKINNNMQIIQTDLEHATNCNPCIVRPVRYNKDRERFFQIINKNEIDVVIKKCLTPAIDQRIKNKIKFTLSRIKSKILK